MIAGVAIWIRRELSVALEARWFVANLFIFLGGGLLLSAFGAGDAIGGYRGFAKAFTGLVHLALLFVPLMALIPAAAVIAGDRENGALEYFLAQPVSAGQVYAGKLGGVAAAMLLSLTVGFGAAGAVAVLRGVPAGLVATLFGFVVLLALVFVALGLAVSAAAPSRARATTIGIVGWLVLVVFGTLGLIVAFIRFGVPESTLVIWTFVNPIEAFRLGVMCAIDPDLSLLGPIGAAVVAQLGTTGAALLAAASLMAWTLGATLMGWWLFRRTQA